MGNAKSRAAYVARRFNERLATAQKAADEYLAALARKEDVGDSEAAFATAAIVIWGELVKRAAAGVALPREPEPRGGV